MRILIIILLILSNPLFSQRFNENWIMSNHLGLNLSDTPKIFNSSLNQFGSENRASISDENGKLLIYTNNIQVYNQFGSVIFDLVQYPNNIQSYSFIIKVPESNNLYYLVQYPNSNFKENIKYYVIDITGNGRLINTYSLNNFPFKGVIKFYISKKAKKSWMICYNLHDSSLSSHLITNLAINQTVTSKLKIGIGINQFGNSFLSNLHLKISPDGNFISCLVFNTKSSSIFTNYIFYDLLLLNFNKFDGKLSLLKKYIIQDSNGTNYVEFSSSSKKLHIFYNVAITQNFSSKSVVKRIDLKQLDTSNPKLVFDLTINSINDFFLLDAPKNRFIVYHSSQNIVALSAVQLDKKDNIISLDTILVQSPLALAGTPFFDRNKFYFLGRSSFPNLPVYDLEQNLTHRPQICINDTFKIKLDGSFADSVVWQFGDGTQIVSDSYSIFHSYKDSGTYLIKTIVKNTFGFDTIFSQVYVKYLPSNILPNDAIICKPNAIQVNLDQHAFDSVLWNDGSQQQTRLLNKKGLFSVRYSKNNCANNDTINVYEINCQLRINNFCLGDSTIFEIEDTSIHTIKWKINNIDSFFTTNPRLVFLFKQAGMQSLTYTYKINNAIFTQTNNFEIINIPAIKFNFDTVICYRDKLKSGINDITISHLWNNQINLMEIPILESGKYFLKVNKGNCTKQDSVQLTIKDCECFIYIPSAFSPNNNLINDSLLLKTDCEVQYSELLIFNKWGEVIIKTNAMGWDGKDEKGNIVMQDVYFYYLKVKSTLSKKVQYLKGSFYLLE